MTGLSRVICIMGMHSGGTSVVARVVNMLGVDLGPLGHVSAPAPGYNLRGLWEYLEMTRVADGVLRTLGGTWDAPPDLQPGWHRASILEPHRERARRIVAATFGDAPLWGWKDPRSSLLLPFWEDVLGSVDLVVVVRSPNDIAASLATRNDIDRSRTLALWERYAQGMVTAISTHHACVLGYENLWHEPDSFAGLAAFLGRPGAHESVEFRTAAADWIDETMWHHRAGGDPQTAVAGLSVAQRELYATLRGHVARANRH